MMKIVVYKVDESWNDVIHCISLKNLKVISVRVFTIFFSFRKFFKRMEKYETFLEEDIRRHIIRSTKFKLHSLK